MQAVIHPVFSTTLVLWSALCKKGPCVKWSILGHHHLETQVVYQHSKGSEKYHSEGRKKAYLTLFKVVCPDIWLQDSFLDNAYPGRKGKENALALWLLTTTLLPSHHADFVGQKIKAQRGGVSWSSPSGMALWVTTQDSLSCDAQEAPWLLCIRSFEYLWTSPLYSDRSSWQPTNSFVLEH